IDWSEGWLIGLVVFHILLTVFTLLTRNHHTFQAILFFLLLVTVRCSESINEYAAQHWKSFSRQQYFDSNGLFISVMFSMPVLFNCMMMVMNWLWLSSSMMITWKRSEIEAHQRRERRNSSRRGSQNIEGRRGSNGKHPRDDKHSEQSKKKD
ncbi:unnamed protein product, partial [Meganyctiphanes norvegica]